MTDSSRSARVTSTADGEEQAVWSAGGNDRDVRAWGDDPTELSVRRPWTVLAGCVLAWIGGAAGAFNGVLFLSLNAQSRSLSSFSDAELPRQLRFFHLLGIGLLGWCLVVIGIAVFAFLRRRWAARALLGMGIVWILVSIFNGLTGAGAGVVISAAWVVASITFVAFVPQSKEWFAR